MFTRSGLMALGLVVFTEEIIWSGRPQGGADAFEVAAYYTTHAASAAGGELLWVVAMGCLVACIAATASALPRLSTIFQLSAIPAIAALTVSAFVAASPALSAGSRSAGEVFGLWQLAELLHRTGTIALYLPIAVGVVAVQGRPQFVLAAAAALALDLGWLGLGFWSFAAQLVWFVLAFSSATLDQQSTRMSPGRRALS